MVVKSKTVIRLVKEKSEVRNNRWAAKRVIEFLIPVWVHVFPSQIIQLAKITKWATSMLLTDELEVRQTIKQIRLSQWQYFFAILASSSAKIFCYVNFGMTINTRCKNKINFVHVIIGIVLACACVCVVNSNLQI